MLDIFCLQAGTRCLWLRVTRLAPRLPADEAERLRALRELRTGVERGDPKYVKVVGLVLELLDGGSTPRLSGRARRADALNATQLRTLEDALASGRLQAKWEEFNSPGERKELELPELPPLPPAPREAATRSFEVRFVDEVGAAISGIEAEFTADGAQMRVTNAAGIALLDSVVSSSANVAILDPEALSKVLDPRWEDFRPGLAPKESNTHEVVFRGGELGPFDLKAEVPNTVVIKPPLGKLFVELWDKTGRVRHANCDYQISGAQSFEGTTDDEGRLLHEDVFPGDYVLSLALSLEEEGADPVVDILEAPLVVLDRTETEPQVRFVGAARRVVMARLRHMFFETNKSFLLPSAVSSFEQVRELYVSSEPSELLIVGHADTTAGPTINNPLSLARAEMTAAYLNDNVEPWLAQYLLTSDKQRWGAHEDELMLSAAPDFGDKPEGEDPVHWFQRTRGLEVDGEAGPKTRRQLITEYMALDGTSLRQGREFDIKVTAHGCSESFPLDDSGDELDTAPADSKEDATDRRVELFFFDAEFGVQPPPPGKISPAGSPQYPLWRKKVTDLIDLQSTFVEGLVVEWRKELDGIVPNDLVLKATQGTQEQSLAWGDGIADGEFRRFIFRKIRDVAPVTLTADSKASGVTLVLWQDQVLGDPKTPPTWQHVLEELGTRPAAVTADDDTEGGAEVPAVSDADLRRNDFDDFA